MTSKRIFSWTSRKSFLPVALLLVASAWSRSPWTAHQTAQPLDTIRQISHATTAQPDATTKARLNELYSQLPLSFEANVGQTHPQVDFISRGSGYSLFLTPREAVLALRAASPPSTTRNRLNEHESAAATVVRVKFVGSETTPRAAAQEELPGKVNYLLGNDPRQWRTGISTYAKVAYQNLYPGVDLVYYGNQRQLEYDFIVSPGTDPDIIALSFEGADQLEVDTQGELVLHAAGGEIRQRKPFIYQDVDGVRHEIPGSYKLKDSNTVGFQLADYDATRPLVIDPVLVYSTFLGGTGNDQGRDIAVDASGNAYVTGFTDSFDFPTTVGAFDTNFDSQDAFVTKLNPSGSALVYSTFLGGGGNDFGLGIAVDTSGNAYVTGTSFSSNFPTTVGAFDTTSNGSFDGFVTKLNPSGSALVYSTFVGGVSLDEADDIALDASGSAYLTGQTFSSDYPTTIGAFDTTFNGQIDVFVTKLNPSGSALVYSTFFGGDNSDDGLGIALDSSGNAYVTGFTFSMNFPTTVGAFDVTHNGSFDGFVRSDAFVTKLNVSGSALVYSTFLGGTSTESGLGIAVDNSGSAYVTGDTSSSDFPTTVGAFDTTYNGEGDVFVTKLNPSGAAPLVYSTFLGGSDNDTGRGIALDTSGTAYVTGRTRSFNFPTTVDAVDRTYNGEGDVFVTKLNASGSAPLIYSTFLGGSSNDFAFDIALDSFGSVYVAGDTSSPDFPTTAGAFDTTHNGATSVDVFVFKLSTVTSSVPATLTLNPPTASNPVDSWHCVTGIVRDASGNPVANVIVRFQVTGSVDTNGSATTDTNGEATFCYFGPPLPGSDTITAFADANGDNVQEQGEPSGVATKTWVLPASTPLCEITNGGSIIAENGDRASFGGNAKANVSGETRGQQQYQDHGPVQRLNMHSINVQAIVCDGSTRASIFGQATINGSGLFNFRINVQDLGGPGRGQDTYWLLMDGYDSGEQLLRGGNIEIRRK